MTDYLEIANSPGMWIACSAIIVVVFFQVVRLTHISFRAGREIGLTRKQMLMAFRSGFVTAIVPSVAILLGLALLIPRLGLPFPWMRLSVIGSVTYELISAGVAATEMGLDGLSGAFDNEVFSVVVWTMSVGAITGLLVVAFFAPSINKLKNRVAGGDEGWMQVMTSAAFFGAVSYMVAQPVVKGGAPLIALLGGFVSMALIGAVIELGKQKWLKEWALSLAIISGMLITGFCSHFFGIGA
jgi:hypothetical protein